jgi:hypothetical protein
MTPANLLVIIRRLEELGEVEVTITSSGEIAVVCVNHLISSHRGDSISKSQAVQSAHPAWVKNPGLPLKLRKMDLSKYLDDDA